MNIISLHSNFQKLLHFSIRILQGGTLWSIGLLYKYMYMYTLHFVSLGSTVKTLKRSDTHWDCGWLGNNVQGVTAIYCTCKFALQKLFP